MLYIGIGILVLLGIFLCVKWFATAEPAKVKKVLGRLFLFLVITAILILLLTGRFFVALGFMIALLPKILRLINFWILLRQFLNFFRRKP